MMSRFVAGVLLSLMLLPARAEQLIVTFGSEYFFWREYEGSSRLLEENGLRYFFGLEAESAPVADWSYGLRSRLYLGRVAYDGLAQASVSSARVPHSTNTDYGGWAAELDFTRHFSISAASGQAWGLMVGLGYDSWRRDLKDSYNPSLDTVVYGYIEDYNVGYGRLGALYSGDHGWSVQGGVKRPFYTNESVGLTRLGFDSDATLKPRPDYSLYATVDYRLNPNWSMGGYYDSYRFNSSSTVQVTGGGNIWDVSQPESKQDALGFYLNYRF